MKTEFRRGAGHDKAYVTVRHRFMIDELDMQTINRFTSLNKNLADVTKDLDRAIAFGLPVPFG